MLYTVTRHKAAKEFLNEKDAVLVEHADDAFWDGLKEGDVVVGTLPAHLMAKASDYTKNPFGFLSMFVPSEFRGVELTVDQMHELGAQVQWFTVKSDESPLATTGN